MPKNKKAVRPAPEITICIRYEGDDRSLVRHDGREIGPVEGSQETVLATLRHEIGPLVVIGDVEQDGNRVFVTLLDPPRAERYEPVETGGEVEPESEPIDVEEIAIEQHPKILPRRFPRAG